MKTDIIQFIKKNSFDKVFPDKTPYKGISVDKIQNISDTYGYDIREIEIAALKSNIIPERYARNMNSLTLADQVKLLDSTVCIVGLGGLGGTVTEILARMGIGSMILIDGDSFEDSNLNRQLLSSHHTLGLAKASVAEKRVQDINPSINVRIHGDFLTDQNSTDLIEGADVIIDCLDSITTRFTLEVAARKIKAPLVSGAVAGNTGQVTTIFPEDPGLKQIYGEPGTLPEKGIETSLGTLPYAVTLVSTLECAEVIKILLDKGEVLRNKLLILNPLDNLFQQIDIS